MFAGGGIYQQMDLVDVELLMHLPFPLVFGLKLLDDLATPAKPDESENDANDALDVVAVQIGSTVSAIFSAGLNHGSSLLSIDPVVHHQSSGSISID